LHDDRLSATSDPQCPCANLTRIIGAIVQRVSPFVAHQALLVGDTLHFDAFRSTATFETDDPRI
jgi:hypothetical protein